MSFSLRLAQPAPLILDGATGTELHRRGVDTGLPLWSANALLNAPDTLRHIHLDYLNAGADIITTNTFRAHRRSLAKAGYGSRARELTHRAVQIAREAVNNYLTPYLGPSPLAGYKVAGEGGGQALPVAGRGVRFIAGSIAPLEDCYSPELVPPQSECESEHAEMAQHLAEAGVDFLLVETMNTIREAEAAARAALATGLPTVVAFVCGIDGRLLSGESLAEAARAVAPLGVSAIGVNCGPAHVMASYLSELQAACAPSIPLVAYGNIGYADDRAGWVNTDAIRPEAYAEYAAGWPVKIVGGCCGTTPDHIRKLRQRIIIT